MPPADFQSKLEARKAERKRYKKSDKAVDEKYGEVISQLGRRQKLGRLTALVFTSFQFYRRFWLACLILFFTRTPIFQVITVLLLNTSFLAVLLHEQMLRSRFAYVREVLNEVLVFVTTYILLCYTEYFILDAGTRNDFG